MVYCRILHYTTVDINAVSSIQVVYSQMTLIDLVYLYITFPLALALMPVFLQKLWTTNDDKLSKFALYVSLSIVLFIGAGIYLVFNHYKL